VRQALIIGSGGHAALVIDALKAATRPVPIRGIVDRAPGAVGTEVLGVPILGTDKLLESLSAACDTAYIGIGATRSEGCRRRAEVFAHIRSLGYAAPVLIHPCAVVAASAEIGSGTQIFAGAVIQPRARIGCNVIINAGALAEHDCTIGDNSCLGPGARLCGGVIVGEQTFIGAGTTVIQNIRIGPGTTVGAAAAVVDNLPGNVVAVGVPARIRDPAGPEQEM